LAHRAVSEIDEFQTQKRSKSETTDEIEAVCHPSHPTHLGLSAKHAGSSLANNQIQAQNKLDAEIYQPFKQRTLSGVLEKAAWQSLTTTQHDQEFNLFTFA
jgi:hypothetical protein